MPRAPLGAGQRRRSGSDAAEMAHAANIDRHSIPHRAKWGAGAQALVPWRSRLGSPEVGVSRSRGHRLKVAGYAIGCECGSGWYAAWKAKGAEFVAPRQADGRLRLGKRSPSRRSRRFGGVSNLRGSAREQEEGQGMPARGSAFSQRVCNRIERGRAVTQATGCAVPDDRDRVGAGSRYGSAPRVSKPGLAPKFCLAEVLPC